MEDFWKNLSQSERDQSLQWAFGTRNVPLIKLVLTAGGISKQQATELVLNAIILGDAEVLELLLDAGAKLNRKHLLYAVQSNPKIVRVLLENGLKPYSQVIIEAAILNFDGILKELLEAGGDPEAKNHSPINKAAYHASADAISTLLKYGEHAYNVRSKALEHVRKMANERGNSDYVKTVEILKQAGLSID